VRKGSGGVQYLDKTEKHPLEKGPVQSLRFMAEKKKTGGGEVGGGAGTGSVVWAASKKKTGCDGRATTLWGISRVFVHT